MRSDAQLNETGLLDSDPQVREQSGLNPAERFEHPHGRGGALPLRDSETPGAAGRDVEARASRSPDQPAAIPDDERFCLDWPAWAARLLTLSAKTYRTRVIGHPDLAEAGPVIYAQWHCEDMSILPHFGFTRANILVSQSRDGAMLSRAVKVMGYDSCRGSSSRGGLGGLLALKRSLENGQSVVLAADGPRGPRGVAKAGPVYLAAKTGRPVYPAGTACSNRHVFQGTWSKTGLPLPGSKLAVVVNPPLFFPPEAARWPTHIQSRLMTAAIEDAVQAARRELERWLKSEGNDQGAAGSGGV